MVGEARPDPVVNETGHRPAGSDIWTMFCPNDNLCSAG
ncbi:hypothetical protein BX265_7597 [Streptomyces sp. TLI_235]|nr:hypothetical protein BX265_7597 [Streptomyces sp. TLI_235]